MKEKLHELIFRMKIYRFFYKTTLKVSLPLSCLSGFLISLGAPKITLAVLIDCFLLSLCTVGLSFDLLYKEIARKKEYYFYYNCSISKMELILVSYLFSLFIYYIVHICLKTIT